MNSHAFSNEQLAQLRLFCDVCDKLEKCRFLASYRTEPDLICIGKMPDGRIMDQYPRYDEEEFRAFLTHYRKLRAEREDTFLNKIMNLLGRHGDSQDRATLDFYKNEISEEGKSWWGAVDTNAQGKVPLTQQAIEDLIINGEVFHSVSEKKDRLARASGEMSLTKSVAFFNYPRFAMTVVHVALKVREIIRTQVLDPNLGSSSTIHAGATN